MSPLLAEIGHRLMRCTSLLLTQGGHQLSLIFACLPSLSLRVLGGSMCQKLDLADAIFGAGR